MEFLKKIIEGACCSADPFVLLTLALAAVLRYTAFSAGRSFAGLLL